MLRMVRERNRIVVVRAEEVIASYRPTARVGQGYCPPSRAQGDQRVACVNVYGRNGLAYQDVVGEVGELWSEGEAGTA